MDENQQEREYIKLDGSMGVGPTALVTISTKDVVNGIKNVTYQIPAALLNLSSLTTAFQYRFISGFEIQHQEEGPTE